MGTEMIIFIAFLLTLKEMGKTHFAFKFFVEMLVKYIALQDFKMLTQLNRILSHSKELVDERETHHLKLFGEEKDGPKAVAVEMESI